MGKKSDAAYGLAAAGVSGGFAERAGADRGGGTGSTGGGGGAVGGVGSGVTGSGPGFAVRRNNQSYRLIGYRSSGGHADDRGSQGFRPGLRTAAAPRLKTLTFTAVGRLVLAPDGAFVLSPGRKPWAGSAAQNITFPALVLSRLAPDGAFVLSPGRKPWALLHPTKYSGQPVPTSNVDQRRSRTPIEGSPGPGRRSIQPVLGNPRSAKRPTALGTQSQATPTTADRRSIFESRNRLPKSHVSRLCQFRNRLYQLSSVAPAWSGFRALFRMA